MPNHRDYTISKAEFDTYHEFKVRANVTGSQNHTVQVMKDEHNCRCCQEWKGGRVELGDCNAILLEHPLVEESISARGGDSLQH